MAHAIVNEAGNLVHEASTLSEAYVYLATIRTAHEAHGHYAFGTNNILRIRPCYAPNLVWTYTLIDLPSHTDIGESPACTQPSDHDKCGEWPVYVPA